MPFMEGGGEVFEADVGEYQPRMPFQTGMDVLANAPGTVQSIGTTGFRGGSTILRGGWGDAVGFSRRTKRAIKAGKAAPQVGGSTLGGALRNNNPLGPRTWTRYGSQEMFFSSGAKGTPYTPFNFLAKGGNWAARQNLFGGELQKAAQAAHSGEGGAGAFAPGFISQMNAAERIGRGAAVKNPAGLANYFSKAGLNVSEEVMASPLSARTATYASVQGAATSKMAGYMAGLRDPQAIETAAGLGEKVGINFATGAGKAAAHLELGGFKAGEKIGARGLASGMKTAFGKGVLEAGEAAGAKVAAKFAATKAGTWAAARFGGAAIGGMFTPAMPFIATALAIMTAFDVAKMVGAGISAAPRFAMDAARSFTGGMNRQGFGVPYRTNELAVTSRARGVQAIQNSRLNARSVIGSEASGMAGYFG